MADLSHLWQRFLLASSLLVGLAIGAAATVFGYSNLGTVDVKWSVFHINGVPLWTVAVVPIVLTVVAGTLYHWMNSFHHFTEHMRHRHRVHELEAEVASLRAHLDHVLDIPDQSTSRIAPKHTVATPDEGITELGPAEMAALPEPAKPLEEPVDGTAKPAHRWGGGRKRATLSGAPAAAQSAESAEVDAAGADGGREPAGATASAGKDAKAEPSSSSKSEA